jgi:hypothetical protein
LLFSEGKLARDGKGAGYEAFGKATEQFQQLVANNPAKEAFRLSLGAAAIEFGITGAQAGKSPERMIRTAIKELRWGREHNPAEAIYAENLLEAFKVLLQWQADHGGANAGDLGDLEAILQWPELPAARKAEMRAFLTHLKKDEGKSRP